MKSLGGYEEINSSQESLNEFDRFEGDEDVEFDVKLAEFPRPNGWGARHTLALLGFLGFCASYAMRVNLAFVIVVMVDGNGVNHTLDTCPELTTNASLQSHNYPDSFPWTPDDQGMILSSFYWSYVVTQIPAGLLARRVGGKWPFGIGLLITSLLCLMTPMAAGAGKWVLMGARIIQGVGEGLTNPAMFALLAQWLPPLERTKLGAFVYSGISFGTAVTLPMCGALVTYFGGWPAGFYVFGVCGVVWFLFWTFFVFNRPEDHPRIDATELDYIRHSIGGQRAKDQLPTPWGSILTSLPVLALLLAMVGSSWGQQVLITELPTYFDNVLHFELRANGWLSAVPHFLHGIVTVLASRLADQMREKKVRTTTVRKIFNTAGQWLPALGFILLAYTGCAQTLALVLIILTAGFSGATGGGHLINQIDLAPNHAAILIGVTNTIGNLAGVGAPAVSGWILEEGESLESWSTIFLLAGGILLLSNTMFLLFGSGEEQEWNRPSIPAQLGEEEIIPPPDNYPLLKPSTRLNFGKPAVMILQGEDEDGPKRRAET